MAILKHSKVLQVWMNCKGFYKFRNFNSLNNTLMENSEKYSYYSAEDRFVDDLKTIFLKALQYVDTSPDNHRIDNELVILISESLKKDEMRIDAVNSYLNKNKHFFD